MMDSNYQTEPLRLKDLIDELVSQHGIWRVFQALLGNALRNLQRPSTAHLSNHLRRDVGLQPDEPPPSLPNQLGPMI